MPQNTQNNMKGTTPSKLVQRGVNVSWGQQSKGSSDPKKVLANKFTNHPVDVAKSK